MKSHCRIYLELLESGIDETVFEWAHNGSPAPLTSAVAGETVMALRALIDGLVRADAPLLFSYIQRNDAGGFIGVFPMVVGPAFMRHVIIWAEADESNDSSETRPQVPDPPEAPEKETPPRVFIPAGPPDVNDADWWKDRRN